MFLDLHVRSARAPKTTACRRATASWGRGWRFRRRRGLARPLAVWVQIAITPQFDAFPTGTRSALASFRCTLRPRHVTGRNQIVDTDVSDDGNGYTVNVIEHRTGSCSCRTSETAKAVAGRTADRDQPDAGRAAQQIGEHARLQLLDVGPSGKILRRDLPRIKTAEYGGRGCGPVTVTSGNCTGRSPRTTCTVSVSPAPISSRETTVAYRYV